MKLFTDLSSLLRTADPKLWDLLYDLSPSSCPRWLSSEFSEEDLPRGQADVSALVYMGFIFEDIVQLESAHDV